MWSPYYKQDIEAIERVQRRFSKRLPGLKEFTGTWRTLKISWVAYAYPRITSPTYRLKMVLQNYVWASSFKLWSFLQSSNSVQIKLEAMASSYKQFSSSTVRSSFFAERVVNVWNSLPTSVDFSTLSALNWLTDWLTELYLHITNVHAYCKILSNKISTSNEKYWKK